VPTQNNGRSIYKPIETAYLHADSSDYGWGAVLNDDSNYHARGFWNATDRLQHITWKELRAVRHAVALLLRAVKNYFRDHQRQPIAIGELLADARRGFEMLQHRLVPADNRLPLPAPIALDILHAANTLRDGLTWSPATRLMLERFRAWLAAVCVNYTFFCRAETGARCQTGDLIVDIPSQQICMFVRKSKGDQRRDTRDKLVFAVPIATSPILADLLDYFTQHRAAFCVTYYKRPPPAAFWSISPAETSAGWGAASTISAWLSLSLRTVNTYAPAGFKWTSHSLRKGAASAASCICAPLPVIKYMGGWAKNNSVTEGKYIDPTMTPTHAAWRFFGWLAPSPPQH
jgi:hypothetical protein